MKIYCTRPDQSRFSEHFIINKNYYLMYKILSLTSVKMNCVTLVVIVNHLCL